MKKFMTGFIAGVFTLLAAGFLFFFFGGMPVATRGKALPMEEFLAHLALDKAIGSEADRPAPFEANEQVYLSGAKTYSKNCAICHGSFEGKPSTIALGLFPHPPTLLPPEKGVTDDPVGETYWKIKNGIRLTGMPGFEQSLTENEMWEMSLLLHDADHLPTTVQSLLRH